MDPLYIRTVLEHLSLTTISFKTPKRPWVQNRELQFSILLRLKFKLRWPRKLGLIEWRITSSFPLKLNWKKKDHQLLKQNFLCLLWKNPWCDAASSIYHWSCLLSGQSVTIKCVTFFFSASLLNWKFEKGSSHELINSFCLRSGFRRDSFIISDDDSWCLSAQAIVQAIERPD